ncbi:hypothetical protein [Kordiimonas sp.]|uniref:hypothetical protein n=1 Tax=Kordiimonas sp. TaxID=1970157 RepID=UPI003A922B0A
MKLHETLEKVQGHLDNLDNPQFDKIDFEWEGIKFHAYAGDDADGGKIYLSAKLGKLYFSIEDSVQRTMAIERIYATNRGIDGAYRIEKNGTISFNSITSTDKMLTGAGLMGALTLILLESETHLRALRAHLKPQDLDP